MNFPSKLFVAITVLWGAGLPLSGAVAQPPEPQPKPQTVAPRQPAALELMTPDELNRAIGGPTLVTMKLAETSAKDAFGEVQRQTGVPIGAYTPAQWATFKKVAPVNITRQPFWMAMRELQTIWDFRFENFAGRPGFTIMPYGGDAGDRTVSVGPCLFSISGLNYSRSVSFARDGKAALASDLGISCRAYLDPKIQVVRNGTYCQIVEAIDEKGQSIHRDEVDNGFSYESNPIRLNLKLLPQATAGKKLTKFKAVLGFVAVTKREVWEVPNVLQARDAGKTLTRDGEEERVSIDAVRKEGDGYEVQVTFSRPRLTTRRVVRLSNGRNLLIAETNHYDQVRLVDAQNRDWMRSTFRIQNQGDRATSIISTTLSFRKRTGEEEIGEPAKLVVTIPTAWHEVRVPFEFKDLPLP